MVSADKGASTGVRYKYGRNLNTNKKNALVIKNPEEYRLPNFGPQPTYIIAKENYYFIYPNEAKKYQAKFRNSYQHGGISLEEMFIPVSKFEGEKVMNFTSMSEEDTFRFALNLAKGIKIGSILALLGNLGSGKTTFAKGFAMGLNITEHVGSPTFKIISEYEGDPHNLYHIDSYRLKTKMTF